MTRRWWSDLAPNTQGALLMTASGVTCSVIAAMVKELSLGGMDGFEIAFFRALIAFIGLLPFSPSPAALDAGPNTLASMSGAASWAAPLPIWVWALTHGIRMMPDGWTIGGATVIVGSTVYIAQREARLMRAGDFNAVKAEAIAAEGRGRDVAIQHGPLECACILEQNAYYRHSVLASRFIKALGNAARDSQQLDAMIQLADVQTPTRY